MTLNEARFVLENRHLYTTETYLWAVEIVETAERQGADR